ncbi:MAG: putative Ig domain-containing protein [Rhodospirillaceae bacterium]|nr:putative Ig domain-containing protein [Rhodospirillaceae bacterium]
MAASPGGDSQGVLRLINRAEAVATVSIEAIDDTGARTSPATVTLPALRAVELSAVELQVGSAAKGLSTGLGSLAGDVRLVIDSDAPIVPSAFVRSADGALSAVNATVHEAARPGQSVGAVQDAYRYHVAVFYPARNATQQSRLRLINPNDTEAQIAIDAWDDAGAAASGGTVRLTLPPGGVRTLTSRQLEAGDSVAFSGWLGAGIGNWRLSVSTDRPIEVVNVAVGAGYLSNLSTTAVAGWAPQDAASFEARFLDRRIVSRNGQNRIELRVLAGQRFRDVGIEDGVESIEYGRYSYELTGRDAGLLSIMYDNTKRCETNLYFESPTSGWYASRCIDGIERVEASNGGVWLTLDAAAAALELGSSPDDRTYTAGTAIEVLTLPEAAGGDGKLTYSLSPEVPGLRFVPNTRRLTGTPSEAGAWLMTYRVYDASGDTDWRYFNINVSESEDEVGSLGTCHVGLRVGIGQNCAYPGTADAFSVNARGRGSFLGRLAGIRIDVSNESVGGRVYDFRASHQGDGVWRIDRIAESTEPPMNGGDGDGDADTSPRFSADAVPGDRTYEVGTASEALTLPEASGGEGPLTYSLSPEVPGLSFNATTRRLTGTPTAAGTYNMTYRVRDTDGGTDSLSFTITVEDPGGGGQTTTFGVGDTLSDLPSGSWDPDVSSGGVAFSSSGGEVTLRFSDGGYIEEGDYRYTCQSGGGCTIRNRSVQSGRIIRTSMGTAAPGGGGGSGPTVSLQRLTHNEFWERIHDQSPSWSPDGQRIAFSSTPDGYSEIYTMDADGGNPQRLTRRNARDVTPSWSPDGQRIVFASEPDDRLQIYSMDADGHNLRRLTQDDSSGSSPSWSPDGQRIAFQSSRRDGLEIYVDLYLMDADGGNPQRLTYDDSINQNAAWSPDGQRIAFDSSRTDATDVFVMDTDGGNPQRLTESYDHANGIWANSEDPSWSPDGQRIAFASHRDGNWEIYIMDADGGNTQRLTDHVSNDIHPAWSPNGQRIAFASDRDGNWEIYALDVPDTDGNVETGQDTKPKFVAGTAPGDQSYSVGTSIAVLTLPTASGGNAPLIYSLSPVVPGLSFNATTRRLTGTPTTADTYDMTYRVRDADGDTDSLSFTVKVKSTEGGGQTTTYRAGETLPDLPAGFWTPDVTSDRVTFSSSGGNMTLRFDDGGYIEEGDYRYTCQNSRGCLVENQRVTSGTVVQTAKGTVPAAAVRHMLTTPGAKIVLRSVAALNCAGSVEGYQWEQLAGSAVSVDNGAEAPAIVVPDGAEGPMTFRVHASCSSGPDTVDTVSVQVVPPRVERVLSALVDFQDVDPADRPFSREDLSGLLVDDPDSLANYLAAASRGLVDVRFDVLDWLTVGRSRSAYASGGYDVIRDVIYRLSEAADLTGYDKVFPAIFPLEYGDPGCAAYLTPYEYPTAQGSARLGAAWLSGYDMECVRKGRHAHEYGHTFGFVHSLALDCHTETGIPVSTIDPTDRGSCKIINECANEACTELREGDADLIANHDPDMLGGDHPRYYEDYFPMVFQAAWQAHAGWLTDEQVVTATGSHWITSLESLSPTPKAIRLPLGRDHAGGMQAYWLETRLRAPDPRGEYYGLPHSRCKAAVRIAWPNGTYDGAQLRGWDDSGHTDTLRFEWKVDTNDPRSRSEFRDVRDGQAFWDPYRGVRFELTECVERDFEAALKVDVDRTTLQVDPPVVAVLEDGTATVTVTNRGTSIVNVGEPTIGGRHGTAFSLVSDECRSATLGPGQTCRIGVESATASLSFGFLQVPNDDDLAPELAVSLMVLPADGAVGSHAAPVVLEHGDGH